MQLRWKDALKRSFELAKFDPRHKEVEKPKVLKKPRFVKVSAIKPEQKGLNLQLKVVKLLDGSMRLAEVCNFHMKHRCSDTKHFVNETTRIYPSLAFV